MGFKYVFSSSVKSKHKRCEATLISSTLNYEHISEISDDEGRFVRITGRLEGSEITILNVYAPQNQNKPLIRKVNSYMEEMGIIHVWKELYPSIRDYTHYPGSYKVYARLDYFFMFNVDRFKIRDCDIQTRDLSDHSPISLSLQVARKKHNTLWKFNSHIFNDHTIVSKIKEKMKEFLEIMTQGRYQQSSYGIRSKR